MPIFLMLRGLPGSGKSTIAAGYVEQGMKRINKDTMRDMIGGGFCRRSEDALNATVIALAEALMTRGFDVVSDNMNLDPKHYTAASMLVSRIDASSLNTMDLHVPIDECISRDALRAKPVGAKVIREIHDRWMTKGFPQLVGYET